MSSTLPLPCIQDFIQTGPECQLWEENMDKGPFKCVKEYCKDLQRQEYGLTPLKKQLPIVSDVRCLRSLYYVVLQT